LRTEKSRHINDVKGFVRKLLEWSKAFDDVVFLDSNQTKDKYSSFDFIMAVDAFTALKTNADLGLDALEDYQRTTRDWIFGHISYDIKNDIEDLNSKNDDGLDFPDLYFFQPKKIIFIKDNVLTSLYLKMVDDDIDKDLDEILNTASPPDGAPDDIQIQSKLSQLEYVNIVNQVLSHIHRGDIYEMNFCQEFYVKNHRIQPEQCFENLNQIARAPFTCFYKHEHLFAIGSSPERFLKKSGSKLISQPIKGTAKRHNDSEVDKNYKLKLQQDPKEVAENVMIVDLVRNDLSKIAKKNSVEVEELCRIYSFKQVHQMISTVSADMNSEAGLKDIIQATFPMGSMTGAPKVSAMQIIENLESTKRGLYSGCIGYITPEFDFDFNVVIRSILHNASRQYTSLMVGSAITHQSIPENEYAECLVKAKALMEVLKNEQVP